MRKIDIGVQTQNSNNYDDRNVTSVEVFMFEGIRSETGFLSLSFIIKHIHSIAIFIQSIYSRKKKRYQGSRRIFSNSRHLVSNCYGDEI